MNVFVTGGAGYVGSVTVDRLVRAEHQVVVFDNLEHGHVAAVHPSAKLVVGDLRNKEEVVRAVTEAKPDAIIHFAAYAYVGESMQRPLDYFENNVTGSLNLIFAAQQAHVKKFIFSSSCATYGVPEHLPITEQTPQLPVNPYGESKKMVEKMLLWTHRIHGMEVVILRYFNACGATENLGEDHRPETHMIPLALQAVRRARDRFEIYGDQYPTKDGTCIRDYVHVKDLARAHQMALQPGLTTILNLGSGSGVSVLDVLRVVEVVTQKEVPTRGGPARPGDPPVLVAGNQKAASVLGWTPLHSDLAEVIDNAWQWATHHPDGYPEGV